MIRRYALVALLVLPFVCPPSPAVAAEENNYRIDWQKGDITQIACDNGAYFTIRYSKSRKLYFVQELVDFYDKELGAVASRACGKG